MHGRWERWNGSNVCATSNEVILPIFRAEMNDVSDVMDMGVKKSWVVPGIFSR